MGRQRIDHQGKTFGYLYVASYAGPGDFADGSPRWNVECKCGTKKVTTSKLLGMGVKSCGCIKGKGPRRKQRAHGDATRKQRAAEYGIWYSMINRCQNEKHESYKDYGGRGITVCERWNASYENFLTDMGRRPTPKHSIERKDNNGPYSPENCVWATKAEQSRNHRRNQWLTLRGRRMCITDWAAELGLTTTGLYYRIKAKWSEDRILETPAANSPVSINLSEFIWPQA